MPQYYCHHYDYLPYKEEDLSKLCCYCKENMIINQPPDPNTPNPYHEIIKHTQAIKDLNQQLPPTTQNKLKRSLNSLDKVIKDEHAKYITQSNQTT